MNGLTRCIWTDPYDASTAPTLIDDAINPCLETIGNIIDDENFVEDVVYTGIGTAIGTLLTGNPAGSAALSFFTEKVIRELTK